MQRGHTKAAQKGLDSRQIRSLNVLSLFTQLVAPCRSPIHNSALPRCAMSLPISSANRPLPSCGHALLRWPKGCFRVCPVGLCRKYSPMRFAMAGRAWVSPWARRGRCSHPGAWRCSTCNWTRMRSFSAFPMGLAFHPLVLIRRR